MQKHSAALDANAASRFLATYPLPGKALAALEQCAVSGWACRCTGGAASWCRCCGAAPWVSQEQAHLLVRRLAEHSPLVFGCPHCSLLPSTRPPGCLTRLPAWLVPQEWRERQGYVGLLEQPHPKVQKRQHAACAWQLLLPTMSRPT